MIERLRRLMRNISCWMLKKLQANLINILAPFLQVKKKYTKCCARLRKLGIVVALPLTFYSQEFTARANEVISNRGQLF